MSQINFSQIDDGAIFKKMLENPYTSIATRVFPVRIEQTENYKQTYNIISQSGFSPKLQNAESNTPAIRRSVLSSGDITYDLFREKIEISERDYKVMLEKGMQSAIENTLQSSYSSHFSIFDSLAFRGTFQSNVTKAFDPNGLLISDMVTELGEFDWSNANGDTKASNVLDLADTVTKTVPNVDVILIGQKAWRKFTSGEVSENGKVGIIDYVKTQLGVGSRAIFIPTNILDTQDKSYIAVFNSSNVYQELFLGKLPHIGDSGIKLDEHKAVYEGYTRSLYGGLVIYKKGAIARASIKL
jgi:hypothetical protein